MKRLAASQLATLDAAVQLPRYKRERCGSGIVHLGIGAFHRAHQAWYTELAMNLAGGNWGITGVSLRSDAVARQLRPQDCLYSLLADDGKRSELRVIGAVRQVLLAGEQLDEVVAAIAAETTQIVSLTITEKGYCSDAAGGTDWKHPALAADLREPASPITAIGLLALGLARRFERGGAALTVLSCDNLAENGRIIQQRVEDFIARAHPHLLGWAQQNVTYPSSMVDRIVPAIDEQQRLDQSAMLGADDASAIATEPFSQWVIEDNFAATRPAWEQVGVTFVDDIRPYEAMKLGLLNAAHTAIACVGMLCDLETVDQVMARPDTGDFIRSLMCDELLPQLDVPAGFDPQAYCDELLQRFANPRLQHRCAQIFMDSSAKIPQRWLPHLRQGATHPGLALALAAWCHLVLHTDVTLDDPAAQALLALRGQATPDVLDRLLAIAGVCPQSVENYAALRHQIHSNMVKMASLGLAGCIEELKRETA